MSSKHVYLSGPIAGLSYSGATSWRQKVSEFLSAHGITALDPMRGKENLQGILHLNAYSNPAGPLSTAKGITTRDRFDCMRADVVLVNLLQAESLAKLSLGTIMEVAWADAARIPIVCIRKLGTYRHPMFDEVIGFECEELWDGVDLVVEMLR